MKVLMLDDSPTFLQATEGLLTRGGVEVIRLNSWIDVGTAISRDLPDVLVLDLNMPGFEGDQVGQMIRRFSNCPILFLSSEPTERLTAVCRGIPNSSFLQKSQVRTDLIPSLLALARRQTEQSA